MISVEMIYLNVPYNQCNTIGNSVGFILQNKLEKYKITKRLVIAFVVKLCYIFRHEFHAVTMKGLKWNMS